jgi:succinyl-diaminopimelate desuccinylase
VWTRKPVAKLLLTSFCVASDTHEVVALATALMRCPSITPVTAGAFEVLEDFLQPLGFRVLRHTFTEEGHDPVENIYFRYGDSGPNFCFAGHTDVVPPGDEARWSVPPFSPQVVDGMLYGRGAEDMKGAIAAFMIAARDYLAEHTPNGSISIMLTQDEEGIAVNGIRKFLPWLAEKGEVIDACVVGEPTNPERLGDMVKVGRRGSISFTITVQGKQGHVAYPERADNPMDRAIPLMHALNTTPLDHGSEFFPPTNLEITTVDVGNPTVNIIPEKVVFQCNVRFNDQHSGATVAEWVKRQCAAFEGVHVESRVSGESFLTENPPLIDVVSHAVEDVTGRRPVLSTTGGTSDARFIKDVCPVVEFGTTGHTPHMIDEHVATDVLVQLSAIYTRMLTRFFA